MFECWVTGASGRSLRTRTDTTENFAQMAIKEN